LWSKGHAAILEVEGQEYVDYETWRPDGEIWLPNPRIPTNLEWKVTRIGNLEVIPGSIVTVTFHPNGKLGGKASINDYTAFWLSSSYRIIITGGISSRMAGSPDLMEQEERFLKLLSAVHRFEFRREGLALIGKNDEEILLQR
jgi:heat shock protein HslJ